MLVAGLLLSSTAAAGQDGYLTNFDVPRYIEANTDHPLTLRARNASGASIEFFQVSWRVDGGTVHTMNQSVGGGGIVGNNASFLEVTHPDQMNVGEGAHVLEVWITVPNDTDQSNDTLTMNFTALNNWAPKVVLIEARTETWCPQCPPANTVTDQLLSDPAYAVVKFHLNDGMEFPDGNDHYGQFDTTFTPQAVLEAGEYGTYEPNAGWNVWSNEMAARAQGVSPVHISMESVVNNSTRVMNVTLEASFTYAINGPFTMNVYLAENNVPGPQANAPPNYIHHGVMRALLGGAFGTSGVIPNNPSLGTTYSHTYTYTIPNELSIESLYLVGVIEHHPGSGGYALNSISSMHSAVGMADLGADQDRLDVFPNPFNSELNIQVSGITANADLQLIGLDGRMILQQNINLNEDRISSISMPGDLAAGPYLLQITTPEGRLVKQVSHLAN